MRRYRQQFRGGGGARVVGEVVADYLQPSSGPANVAQRIQEAMPDVRLIAIVRQPVERMFSAFRDHVVHGRIQPDTDPYAMVLSGHPDVEKHDLVGGGLYAQNLYPFRRRFGEQLLILFVDDIRDDPAKVYDVALRHIGADAGFVPPHLDRVLYSNAASRWTARLGFSDEQRRILHMPFRRDIEELEAMTGRYLPQWDPGPPPLGWSDLLEVPE